MTRTCSPIDAAAPNSSRAVVAPRMITLAPERSSASVKLRPSVERPVAHFEEIVVDAVDRRRPVGVADHDRRRAADHAGDRGDARDLGADDGEVAFGQRERRAFAGAPSARGERARRDDQQIGAERLDPRPRWPGRRRSPPTP